MIFIVTLSAVAEPGRPADLAMTLKRVGERIERHFTRAQSIICLETVHLQPLGGGLSPEGFARRVESELRLSWDPLTEITSLPEARMLRHILKINGQPPRRNDPHNCTSPEQNSTETHPLSMLLPQQQKEYAFSLAGLGRVDRRAAIILDYTLATKPSIDVHQIEGSENCISFSINGGMRGRIWIDAESYDVLRLDQRLSGLIDIPLPPKAFRRSGGARVWTLERFDTSVRFKPVIFQNPDETLTLPISVSSLRITRGAGTPRLRTITEYSGYKRFLTDSRLVKE